MSDSDNVNDGRIWAYVGAILGGAESVAANVAHSYVPPATGPDGKTPLTSKEIAEWEPMFGAVASSVFWPLFLFVGIEILARYDWPGGRRWLVLRYGGLVPVMLVAAVVSYRHMSGLLSYYGEDPLTVAIGPLAVDGLMAMATGALIASGTRRKDRRATKAATPTTPPRAAASAPAASPASAVAAATVARPAVVTEPVAPKPKATSTPRPRPERVTSSDSDLRTQARDMYTTGERHLATIALKLGTNKRNVERWTKDLRAGGGTATSDADSVDPEPAAVAAAN